MEEKWIFSLEKKIKKAVKIKKKIYIKKGIILCKLSIFLYKISIINYF